jgi:hypothetical protein
MGWKLSGRVTLTTTTRNAHLRGQTDNGYRGVSQRLIATPAGAGVRVYRSSLNSGVEYRHINVGNLTADPCRRDGLAAVDVAVRCRSGHSSLRLGKPTTWRRAAVVEEKLKS